MNNSNTPYNSTQTFIINAVGGGGGGGNNNILIHSGSQGWASNAVYINTATSITYNFSMGTAGAWQSNPLEIKKSEMLIKINNLTKSCLDILVRDELNLPSDEELFNTVLRMLKQKAFV